MTMTTTTAPEPNVDLAVSRVVKILLTYRRETQAQLGEALFMNKKTLMHRMAGRRGWSASEVAQLAKHFEVPVGVFYAGPDALLSRSTGTVTHQYESPTKRGGTTVSTLNSSTQRAARSTAVRPRAAQAA